jgi:serine/threonine protein kinase
MSDAASSDLVTIVISVTVVFAVLGAIAMTYILCSYLASRRRRRRQQSVDNDALAAAIQHESNDAVDESESHRRPIASVSASSTSQFAAMMTRGDSHRVPLSAPAAELPVASSTSSWRKNRVFASSSPSSAAATAAPTPTSSFRRITANHTTSNCNTNSNVAAPEFVPVVLDLGWPAASGLVAVAKTTTTIVSSLSHVGFINAVDSDAADMHSCEDGSFIFRPIRPTAGSSASASPLDGAASRSTQRHRSSRSRSISRTSSADGSDPDTASSSAASSAIGELAAPDAMRSFRLRSSGLVRSQTDDDFSKHVATARRSGEFNNDDTNYDDATPTSARSPRTALRRLSLPQSLLVYAQASAALHEARVRTAFSPDYHPLDGGGTGRIGGAGHSGGGGGGGGGLVRAAYSSKSVGGDARRGEFSWDGTVEVLAQLAQHKKDNLEIERSRIELMDEVGHGAFARVYIARYLAPGTDNPEVVAVKQLLGDAGALALGGGGSADPFERERRVFMHEMELMKKLMPHENVVQLIGVCTDLSGPQWIVTEFCFRESDQQLLTSRGFLYLDQLEALVDVGADGRVVDWRGVTVANYDAARRRVRFETPRALVVRSAAQAARDRFVEFRAADVRLVVTARHDMYVSLDDGATFAKRPAEQLLALARTGRRAVRWLVSDDAHSATSARFVLTTCAADADAGAADVMLVRQVPSDGSRAWCFDMRCGFVVARGASRDGRRVSAATVQGNCAGGALLGYLRDLRARDQRLGRRQTIEMMLQTACGVRHLHQQHIVHRDIAARNMLLAHNGVIKVGDFGLSRNTLEDGYHTRSRTGPLRWMAVESLVQKTYSTRSDIWSFGILMWEIETRGLTPYFHIRNQIELVMQIVREGVRLPAPAGCPLVLVHLMDRCWNELPTDRPDMESIVSLLRSLKQEYHADYVETENNAAQYSNGGDSSTLGSIGGGAVGQRHYDEIMATAALAKANKFASQGSSEGSSAYYFDEVINAQLDKLRVRNSSTAGSGPATATTGTAAAVAAAAGHGDAATTAAAANQLAAMFLLDNVGTPELPDAAALDNEAEIVVAPKRAVDEFIDLGRAMTRRESKRGD